MVVNLPLRPRTGIVHQSAYPIRGTEAVAVEVDVPMPRATTACRKTPAGSPRRHRRPRFHPRLPRALLATRNRTTCPKHCCLRLPVEPHPLPLLLLLQAKQPLTDFLLDHNFFFRYCPHQHRRVCRYYCRPRWPPTDPLSEGHYPIRRHQHQRPPEKVQREADHPRKIRCPCRHRPRSFRTAITS